MKNLWEKILSAVVLFIGRVHWGFSDGLTDLEMSKIRELLTVNYYIILTRRKNHLSTFFTELAQFLLTGTWGYWAHSLMNAEDAVLNSGSFRLVEATAVGTHYSAFDDVFQVHAVALLKPKSMSVEHWTAVLDKLKSDIGKPYDTLFDITQEQKLSCVELIRNALMSEPNYTVDFANFEAMVRKYKRITPDMFADCPDFEIVYTVRH